MTNTKVDEYKNSAASLEAFKVMPHPQVAQQTVDETVQNWQNVLQQGLQPMMSALQEKKFAEYRRVFRDDFHPLNDKVYCCRQWLSGSRRR
ncbi:Tar ligand binding domain-containing protein [Symbiopectobacterium sp.]|uniref:Tar ligand binding domain-containing protein n=1 Tax=Symbiopectobacterium sp. TaxID=2952789 RepID=UPI003F3B1C31